MSDYWNPPGTYTTTTSTSSAGWYNENDGIIIARLQEMGYEFSDGFKEKIRTPIKSWKNKIEG